MWRANVWLYACFAYSVPSSWGVFVCRELTSKVASIVSLGICSDSMNSTKSLMYEGSCFTAGWRYVSMNLEMFSVAELQLLTMGLSDMGFLCVFFRKYVWCSGIVWGYQHIVLLFVCFDTHFLQYFVDVLDKGCGGINVQFYVGGRVVWLVCVVLSLASCCVGCCF